MEPTDNARLALIACLKFLIAEQSWEDFRADQLYASNKEKQTASERNAEKLRRFLRDIACDNEVVRQCIKEASA